jgi:hypothetical protein
MRPLLLLDVDGPLNPQHGVQLNALTDTFDLVWAEQPAA